MYGVDTIFGIAGDHILHLLDKLESSELGASPVDFSRFADLLHRFGRDTEGELWDSEEEVIAHYQDPENFERLVSGLDGKNLIQSYSLFSFLHRLSITLQLHKVD